MNPYLYFCPFPYLCLYPFPFFPYPYYVCDRVCACACVYVSSYLSSSFYSVKKSIIIANYKNVLFMLKIVLHKNCSLLHEKLCIPYW